MWYYFLHVKNKEEHSEILTDYFFPQGFKAGKVEMTFKLSFMDSKTHLFYYIFQLLIKATASHIQRQAFSYLLQVSLRGKR